MRTDLARLLPVLLLLSAACAGPRYSSGYRDARDLYREGRFEEAEKAFDAAARDAKTSGDRETLAQSLSEKAWMIAELGRYPEAVRLMREAIEVTRGEGNAESIHWARLGALQARMGFYTAGLLSARQGLDAVVAKRRKSRPKLAEAGRDAVLDDAMEHPGLPPDVPLIKSVTAAEGAATTIHYLRGDYEKAVETGRRAIKHFQDISGLIKMANSEEKRSYHEGFGLTQMAVGASLIELGKYEEGREVLARARKHFAKSDYTFGDLIAEGVTAYSFIQQGDYKTGMRLSESAFPRIIRSGIDEIIWRMRFEFALDVAARADELQAGFQELSEARDPERIRDLRESLMAQKGLKGEPLLRLLSKDKAERFRSIMDEFAGITDDKELAVKKGLELAKMLRRFAYESALSSIESIETLRGSLGTDLNKRVFLGDKRKVYELAVLLALDLEGPGKALELCERARARGLADLFAGQELRGRSPELLRKEAELRRELQKDYLRASKLRTGTADKASQVPGRQDEELRKKEGRYRDLLVQLRREVPETLSLISPEPLSRDILLASVPKETDLLYYFVTDQALLVWTLGADGLDARRVPVSRQELSSMVTEYRKALMKRDGAQERELARKLHGLLVEPFEKGFRHEDLLIVPHDSLHYLPFAALGGRRRLVEERAVFIQPSLTAMRHLSRRKRTDASLAVIVGDPDAGDKKYDLPAALAESSAVAKLYPGSALLQRKEASRARLLPLARKAAVLHLATHAEYDPAEPMLSGFLLSAPDPSQGLWTAADIVQESIPARLGVLSACRTAMGRLAAGDEIIGLNRALFHAGVGTLVSSLWSVEDESTAILMTGLHRALRAGKPPARALREAQLALKERRGYGAPFFWAAFNVYGTNQRSLP